MSESFPPRACKGPTSGRRIFITTVAILALISCGEKAGNDNADSALSAADAPSQSATLLPQVAAPSDAPPRFATYDEAIDWVRNSSGLSCQSTDTERSSWIHSAEFCSDGSGVGYAIFELRDKEYIHADVPESVWIEFTQAPSLGQYYDFNIRGRYNLELSGGQS
jgi:hypothetical protein